MTGIDGLHRRNRFEMFNIDERYFKIAREKSSSNAAASNFDRRGWQLQAEFHLFQRLLQHFGFGFVIAPAAVFNAASSVILELSPPTGEVLLSRQHVSLKRPYLKDHAPTLKLFLSIFTTLINILLRRD